MIGWKDYPKPNLRFIRNVWVVEVSIPTSIRHLFGNGSGTTNNKRKATGTTDKAIAERRATELTHKIYKEFDEAQLEYANRNNKQMDKYAEDVIYGLADLFKYNRGMRPTLEPSTDYDELVKMKEAFDNYAMMVEDQKAVPIDTDLSGDEMIRALEEVDTSTQNLLNRILSGVEVDVDAETEASNNKVQKSLFPEIVFDAKQTKYLQHHSEPIVQSYWQDLLTSASQEQGKKPPVFKEIADVKDYVIYDERVKTMGLPLVREKPDEGSFADRMGDYRPISRPRRNKVKNASNILSVLDEHFIALERDQAKKDTIRKLKKGVKLFVKLMGDLPLQDVGQTTVYSFMDKQQEVRPNVSARVLKDNNWSLRSFFKFCIERGYVKVNPVADIDVGRRGIPVQTHLNYTRNELHTIFSHNWEPQERLLLSLLITTGMRLSEAANLSWERFSEDHDGIQGMSCLLYTSDAADE